MTEWDPSEPTHTCLHCGRTTLVDSEVCEWCGAPNTPDPSRKVTLPRLASMLLFLLVVLPCGCFAGCSLVALSSYTGQTFLMMLLTFAVAAGVCVLGYYTFRK